MTSLTGKRRVKTAVLLQLRVGKVVFQNRPALLIDRHDPDAPAGDGLLPLSEFVSVSFNASEGFLIVRGRHQRIKEDGQRRDCPWFH